MIATTTADTENSHIPKTGELFQLELEPEGVRKIATRIRGREEIYKHGLAVYEESLEDHKQQLKLLTEKNLMQANETLYLAMEKLNGEIEALYKIIEFLKAKHAEDKD